MMIKFPSDLTEGRHLCSVISKTIQVKDLKNESKLRKFITCRLYRFHSNRPSVAGLSPVQAEKKIDEYLIDFTKK